MGLVGANQRVSHHEAGTIFAVNPGGHVASIGLFGMLGVALTPMCGTNQRVHPSAGLLAIALGHAVAAARKPRSLI